MIRPLLVACIALLPFSAQADTKACYSNSELEAEMLVRLHSELMVVTLACRTSSTGKPLPPSYTSFTTKHLNWLKDSEARLMSYYKRNGPGAPEAKLDRLRTVLGNAYSQEIADLSPIKFCAKYRDNAATAENWNQKEIHAKLQTMALVHPSLTPLCTANKTAQISE